jgi:undecaprenyl-diphosphatase
VNFGILDWAEAFVLGLIQGLTEFLPVSSDGHLALGQAFFDTLRGVRRLGNDKLLLDVILHVGTLVAVLIYYRDWFRPLLAFGRKPETAGEQGTALRGPIEANYVPADFQAFVRVSLLAIVATIPTGIIGLAVKKVFEQAHDSLFAAALGFWFTGIVLWWSQKKEGGKKTLSTMTMTDAFLIGLAQSIAPLPGVSRSGMTVSAALARGLDRSWAAIFSLWMSIPAILGAVVMEAKDLFESDSPDLKIVAIGLLGSVVSGIVGYGAILWLVRLVKARKLQYFSYYLFGLGVAVLIWAFVRG